MKASGGKDIVLVPLVLARYSKTSKSGIQMGLRRRRTISNEIEHVGKQKPIIYYNKTILCPYVQIRFNVQSLRGPFSWREVDRIALSETAS